MSKPQVPPKLQSWTLEDLKYLPSFPSGCHLNMLIMADISATHSEQLIHEFNFKVLIHGFF